MECGIVFRNDMLLMKDTKLQGFIIVRGTSGKWSFPTFHSNYGETPIETCKRVFAEVTPCHCCIMILTYCCVLYFCCVKNEMKVYMHSKHPEWN